MAEFTTPEFLLHSSPEEVHKTMVDVLPADIDLSEGSHAWNFTFPTALVVAEIREFLLPEVIKLVFPEHSYGEFLDGHAKARSITRRAATAAAGEIIITGVVGTVIPAGSLFSTASVNDEPSVDYKTLAEVTIPESGSITVEIQCTEVGIVGNTTENTIVLVASKLTGITGVTNGNAVTGGTEEESDESLIIRIDEYDKSQGDNYVGSEADYKRWATSVPGVGEATVISAQDDSGVVTIVITDANGSAATEQLCESVYNFIMRPDAPGERLAPVNALLSVVPPSTMAIAIRVTVELDGEAAIETVKTAFMNQLALYLPVAMDEQEIKYTRVAACLSATPGVNDFSDLQIGLQGEAFGTANIPITTKQLPEVSAKDIEMTAGTV